MNRWTKTLLNLGILGTAIVAGTAIPKGEIKDVREEIVVECAAEEIELNTRIEEIRVGNIKLPKVTERICLTPANYASVKLELAKEYDNKTKGYDFDIMNRELLFTILGKEAIDQGKGDVLLGGNANEIINLIR